MSPNVVCTCNFDMMFTFMYSDWEGTANDSRVFYDVVMRVENEFPKALEGEYSTLHVPIVLTIFFFFDISTQEGGWGFELVTYASLNMISAD